MNKIESLSLSQKWEAFQKGVGDKPKTIIATKIYKDDENKVTAVLTKEVVDRDGEVVEVAGITLPSDKTVRLLNSHKMNDDVVVNVLGSVTNLRKTKEDGVAMIKGDITFANSPYGAIAKELVMDGHVNAVSIGFGVAEYDPGNKHITKSELWETSLVAVPANPEALISLGKGLKNADDEVSEIEKVLDHYKTIKPAWSELTKTFLSENFAIEIGYKKTGDVLIDLNNIFSVVLDKFKSTKAVTQQVEKITSSKKQAPTQGVKTISISQKELNELISKKIDALIGAK